MIRSISVVLNENHGGIEDKGVDFPALMFRKSNGDSNDFYHEDPYKTEDLYLRAWNVVKYGDSKISESGKGLIGLGGESLVELRMDLPAGLPQEFSGTHRVNDDHRFIRPNQGTPPASEQEK